MHRADFNGAGPLEPAASERSDSDRGASQHAVPLSLAQLADAAPVWLWSSRPDGVFDFANRGWSTFVGGTPAQPLGLHWQDFIHPDDRKPAMVQLLNLLSAAEPFEIELRLRRHDGNYRWVLVSAAPRLENGRHTGHAGSAYDITDRHRAQAELMRLLDECELAKRRLADQVERYHELADADPLTGVLNRRSFRERFERESSRAGRHQLALSAIMLDIDFFKKINDTHGHLTGDAVLKQVANLLTQYCRPSDLVCRYGGEEFCIMAPETDESGAAALAERLRVIVEATRIEAGGATISITSSFGVAQFGDRARNVEKLIDNADHALHAAKHLGRNRVVSHAALSDVEDMTASDSPNRVLRELTAGDLVTPTPCIDCDESIEHAIELLLQHGVGSAPVIDSDGNLVGFLSERDLMQLDVSSENWSRPVREVMKTNVMCYEETACGHEVFQFLSRVSLHRIVVVKAGRPIGIISPSSLLNYYRERVAIESGV